MKMGRRALLSMAAIVLTALVAFAVVSYRRDLALAQARISSDSLIAQTRCGPIEYAVAGSGSPVLMIHGAGGGFDQGLDFARPLIGSGFQVIAVSRFGYLRTPLPGDASPMAQADAHACLLDALNIPKAAIIGGSAGAPSALQLCIRHPERCSVLVLGVPILYAPRDAAAPPPPAIALFLIKMTLRSDFIFWLDSKLAPDAVTRNILATPPADVKAAGRDEQQRVASILHHILPISPRAAGIQNDMAIGAAIQRYDLEHCMTPTLLITAENDLFGTYANARYTARQIPRSRFVSFSTGGHLWVGHNREVWFEIRNFLSPSAATRISARDRVTRRAGK